jgi:hypothetical protein
MGGKRQANSDEPIVIAHGRWALPQSRSTLAAATGIAAGVFLLNVSVAALHDRMGLSTSWVVKSGAVRRADPMMKVSIRGERLE